ncbi:peptide ABC transporter substrate-binding protein [Geomicrobium sp. JCM 19039]|uniref:peptide ABC transporter substrate-binding protein n=1 Tax=Geomicrobium sp. JCM 19039 TaxID=1460636 RepID=UPI00045F45A4|nr:peptide ABC transporter substrate-binding protein [Geomicrobium sp. JCM 19039]GAK10564.1 oligopeptide ABC transporter, periplasmic oligopeptide-binding protein OppA [Geomicrobium sp. JCM 19039]
MKRKWFVLLFAMLLSMVLLLAACSGEETDSEGDDTSTDDTESEADDAADDVGDNVLVMNNGQEPTSLDPPIGNDEYSYTILNNTGEGLTRLAQDEAVPEPAMAEDWDVSDDGLTYTFYIRDGVEWSNGEPVTAHDFEYSFKRLADPDTASGAAQHSYWIAGAEAFNAGEGDEEDVQVTAIDDQTLEVVMENPTDFFPSITAMPQLFPVHQETVENDANWAGSIDTIVTNGPFNMVEWDHDVRIVLEKNENYWDADSVNLDGVQFEMVDDSSTAYQLYEDGTLDIVDIPADMMETLVDSEDSFVAPRAGIEFQRFDVNEEPFHNKKIRQAFNYAIDSQVIVDQIIQGNENVAHGFVAYGFLTPDGNDYRDYVEDFYAYDPERAVQLLEEGMAEEGYDELPTVTLSYNTSDQHSIVSQAMQEMLLTNLDIDIELENSEWSVFLEAQQNVDLQYSRSSFLGGYNDPINFLDVFTTNNPMNRTDFSNDEYDALISESYTEEDPDARFELLYEAEAILMEEAPIVPLYFYNHTFLYKPEVNDVVRHAVGFVELKWASLD